MIEKLKEFLLNLFRKKEKVVIPEHAKNGYGLEEVEVPKRGDHVLGGRKQSLRIILSRERDYSDSLPVKELQKKDFESFNCVPFSGNNVLETIMKKKYDFEINISDRYPAGMIPLTVGVGTSYTKFWDMVRADGFVLEEDYPWGGRNQREYIVRPPQNIIDKGRASLQEYEIWHDWVDWGGCDPEKLWNALKYSPIQVTVNAGATYTKRRNANTDHSIEIYKGEYRVKWYILDHYNDHIKYTVPWNFYFGAAKMVSIEKKKKITLVQVVGDPKLYATYGATACHIADEYSWTYGIKLGIWTDKFTRLHPTTFKRRFTMGDQILFRP